MTPDDVLLLLEGGGENGKSTILEGIARTLGKGYAVLMSDRMDDVTE
jgi:putative DNA primase/helicase